MPRLLKAPATVGKSWNEDTLNRFMVGAIGTEIVLSGGGLLVGSQFDALNLAAWLVVLASGAGNVESLHTTDTEFIALVNRIRRI